MIFINHKEAAAKLAASTGGKVWDKKADETRIYIGKGYLRVAPETKDAAQVQYFLKIYDKTLEIKEAVNQFNSCYVVTATESEETDLNRAALVAIHGHYEVCDAEADVARENWDI